MEVPGSHLQTLFDALPRCGHRARMSDDDGERLQAREKKRARRLAASTAPPQATRRRWVTEKLLVGLLVGFGTGSAVGYFTGRKSKAAEVDRAVAAEPMEAVGPLASSVIETDKFGRPATDQHFGHDHPVENAAPAAPAQGGPDKFGRPPGSEHYGHDHQ